MSFSSIRPNAVTACLATAGLLSLVLPAGAVTKLGSLKLTGTGDFMELPVGFMSDDGVTCLQFDLNYNPAGLPLGAPVSGTAASSHRLDSSLVSPGLRRVVIYSTTLAPLDGGVILRFPAKGASSSSPLPTLSGVRLVSTSGSPVVLTGTDLRTEPLQEAAQVTGVAGGSLTLNAPGGGLGPLTYQWFFEGAPIGGATGSTYTINKVTSGSAGSYSVRISGPAGEVVSEIARVTIKSNSSPIATSRTVTVTEDIASAITLSGTDSENDPLTYSITIQPRHGKLSGKSPNLIYKPNPNANGSDSFAFIANDGISSSSPATVSIAIRAVNDRPNASNMSLITKEDTALAIALRGNDIEKSPLRFSIISQPTMGKLTGTAPNITYKPNPNANGLDHFTYRVNDGTLDSGTATATISITPVNDAPFAKSAKVNVLKNKKKAINLVATDIEKSALKYQIVRKPKMGTLTGKPPRLTYRPKQDATGIDSFTFRVNDGKLTSSVARIQIKIANAKPREAMTSKKASIPPQRAHLDPDPFVDFLANAKVSETQREPSDDPDGDGIVNLLEFVLGGDPSIASTSVLPIMSARRLLHGSELTLQFHRKIVADDVYLVVEHTSSLSESWTEAIDGENGVRIDVTRFNAETERVTVTIPTDTTQRYARLKAIR